MAQAATWTSHTGSSGSGSALVTTKAAEANKSHYVTGIVASANFWFAGISGNSYLPESCEVTLFSGVAGASEVIMLQMQLIGDTVIVNSSSYYYNGVTGGSGPLVINFPSPLMVPENKNVNLRIDPLGSGTSINMDVNIIGFTATDQTTPA